MNAIADALRALLRFADNVPTDSQLAARMTDGTTGLAAIVAARAALAAHDAAVAAGGWVVDAGAFTIITPRERPEYCDIVHAEIPQGLDESDDAAHIATAHRIVTCVNACEGIADPAAFIAAARQLREKSAWIEDDGCMDSAKDAFDAAEGAA